VIAGWAEVLHLPINTVLYDMSMANLILYTAALPHYDDEREKTFDPALDADNPENFNDSPDGFV
jgi:hypothetical protein